MSMTKKAANDIANKVVAELGGDWQSNVNMTRDFYVKIHSDSLGTKLVMNPEWNGGLWSVYSDIDYGFICAAETPKDALNKSIEFYSNKVSDLQKMFHSHDKSIASKIQNMMDLYQDRIIFTKSIVNN